MFIRNSRSAPKFHLLYDRINEHYNVISNLKDAMAKQYICEGCDRLYDNTHKYDKVCNSVLLHHLVPRNRPSIVVHATGGFAVGNVFRMI